MRRTALALGLLVAIAAPTAASAAEVAPATEATGGAVSVWKTGPGGKRVPCPDVDASDPYNLEGGCFVEAVSSRFTVKVHSLVGDVVVRKCEYEHYFRVDATGRMFMEDLIGGGEMPCNDFGACMEGEPLPWQAQLRVDPQGRFQNVVQACFDTCMGQFRGEMRLGLERRGGRWTMTADHALAGTSGFEIDGSWKVARGIDIRPAGEGASDPDGSTLPGRSGVPRGSATPFAGLWTGAGWGFGS